MASRHHTGVRNSIENMSAGISTGQPSVRMGARSNALVGGGAGAMGLTPRGNSLLAYDSAPAFRITSDRGIPNKASIDSNRRNRERMQTLMVLPMHKSGTVKFDGDPAKRTIHALTHEDTGNFSNMGLISTLRISKGGEHKVTAEERMHSIDNPPSFYEDDLQKWKKKFAAAV